MKRNALAILLLAIAFIASFPAAALAEGRELVILHTNDIHGRVLPFKDKATGRTIDGAPGLLAKIEAMRKLFGSENVLLIDAGDMSQGTPMSNMFCGDPVTDFMNRAGYDCSTLGNHEFEWGRKEMERQIKRRRFPIVCTNIVDKRTRKVPALITPFTIVERGGMKIGLIGLTPPENVKMCFKENIEDFEFTDPLESVNKSKSELHSMGIRTIGIVSHLGYEEDLALAERLEGVAFIIGAHTHTAVEDPKAVNGIPVFQTGCHTRNLGVARIVIDPDTGKTLSFKGTLIPNSGKDEGLLKDMESYNERVKSIMAEKIGEAAGDVPNRSKGDKSGTTAIGDLITDIMRDISKTDLFIINSSSFKDGFRKGAITKEDLFYAIPYDNRILTFSISGADLPGMIDYYFDRDVFCQVSGITMDYDAGKPMGSRFSSILVNGRPIDPKKTYKVGMIDFLYSMSNDCPGISRFTNVSNGKPQRDEVEKWIRSHGALSAPEGVRIRLLNGKSPGDRKGH